MGLDVVAVPYADAGVDAARRALLGVAGALVWVNPIESDRDRSVLDALLREVARTREYVSAHPDVIDAIGTKEVLYATRDMPCGSDNRRYATLTELRAQFPVCLGDHGPRVVKKG